MDPNDRYHPLAFVQPSSNVSSVRGYGLVSDVDMKVDHEAVLIYSASPSARPKLSDYEEVSALCTVKAYQLQIK
jgi:hypothetical protein